MSSENKTNNGSSEGKSGARNLMDELNAATPEKKPSTTKDPSWNFKDDEVEQEKGDVKSQQQEQNQQGAQQQDPNKSATQEQLLKGSQAAAATVEFCTSLLSETIINLKYYFKFNAEEREKLDEEILDKPETKRTEEEQTLANRFDRLMNRRDAKLKNVKLSEQARKRMEDGFMEYAKITGKPPMNPKSLLYVTISEAVVKSVINAVLD